MRMIMHVDFPVDTFNDAVRDGTAGEKIQRIMDSVRPEAAWFSEENGQRGGIFVVNVAKASDIPRLAEPFFLTFEADVRFRIAMTPEDLAASGLDEISKEWG